VITQQRVITQREKQREQQGEKQRDKASEA
jgi:hypothetical protein